MGYRELSKTELVQDGDEVSVDDGKSWEPSKNIGAKQAKTCLYRRPIADANPLALDVSLEKSRALHRVWRALNDGDCPKCHQYRAASEMFRGHKFLSDAPAIACPSCNFHVTHEEIEAIEKMFAPAMDAAVAIFEQWRLDNKGSFPA